MRGRAAHPILYVIETSGLGGAEENLVQVASLLGGAYRARACLFKEGWLYSQLSQRGVAVSRLTSGGWLEKLSPRLNLPLMLELIYRIRRERIALVHAYMFAMGLHGCLAARACGIPSIFSVRGQGYEWATGRRRAICRALARLGTHFTAVSQDIARALALECGLPERQITCIPNGVDAVTYAPGKDRAAARARLGLRPGLPTIGVVSRLEPIKGITYLIQSLGRIEAAIGPVQLAIAGDGSERAELERLAEHLRGNSQVIFLGARGDIPEVMASLDAFVLPSLSEGMSNALLQAMASGLPCVATAVGGSVELLRPGETGLLVPPRDPARLAEAVISVARSEWGRRTLGAAARREVEQRYTVERMVTRNQELYASLIGARRPVLVDSEPASSEPVDMQPASRGSGGREEA